MNDILMFEDGFVLVSCNFLIISLRKEIFHINCRNLCMYKLIFMFFSSPEPLGSQGELIVYPSSRRPSVVHPSSTIFKDLLL